MLPAAQAGVLGAGAVRPIGEVRGAGTVEPEQVECVADGGGTDHGVDERDDRRRLLVAAHAGPSRLDDLGRPSSSGCIIGGAFLKSRARGFGT